MQDLAALLNKMGARIEGAGTSTIRVRGRRKLHGAEHTIIPDRIEAGTFLIAGAITRGDLVITGCVPEHLDALTSKLRQAGAEVTADGSGRAARAGDIASCAPPTSPPKNIPDLPPTCRRSTWR